MTSLSHSKLNQALAQSAWAGDLAQVQFWVEQGADLHANNEKALCRAIAQDHLPVVQWLVEQGADLDKGLLSAIEYDQVEILQWLEGVQRARTETLLLEAVLATEEPRAGPSLVRM